MFEVRKKIEGEKWNKFPFLGRIDTEEELTDFCHSIGLNIREVRILGCETPLEWY